MTSPEINSTTQATTKFLSQLPTPNTNRFMKPNLDPNWPSSPAPESREAVRLAKSYGLFINGEFTPSLGNRKYWTINPANEERLSRISESTPEDVDRAVRAARECYENDWSRRKPAERGKYLFRIARLIQERSRELAVLESLDGGKPIRESREIDIPLAAAHFFYHAGWADKLAYAFPNRKPTALGVAAQVIPWNFPLLMAAWKIAPALACGNTVVLKPAETTPLTALLLAEIIQQADLPAGAVNILTGHGPVGQALTEHPDVDKVAFTGSTKVGKSIQHALAASSKRCTLELGGKGAHIVFADAPIDQAVEGVVNGIYFNQGHVCCAGSRLLIEESVSGEVIEKLKFRMQTLRVGDPLDKNTDIGAIHSRQQWNTIQAYLENGQADGATIYQPECPLPETGFWARPTLFTDVSQANRISREEIFGPVLAVQTFRTVAEAISKANNTRYGLSAGVWTEKGARVLNMAAELKAGVIWANTYNQFDPTSPFGGYGESGFGREGGLHGLGAYLAY